MSRLEIDSDFTHFVSLSMGSQKGQVKGIEKIQSILRSTEGTEKKENLEKLHINKMTLTAMTQEELEAMKSAFRRAGDCFTDITGKGPFIIAGQW